MQDFLKNEGHLLSCVSEIPSEHFWQGIGSTWTQDLTLDSQVNAIHKILLHAKFLMFINPHQHGESEG
ncbi:MAG TPA: hypothetical protein DDY91_15120, partial [Planctomycetaceae bacterium]|nr:hypothetical protein [Planctomycetaceae bacterium]